MFMGVVMLFSSNLFLFLFLPAVLFGYYILPRRLRNLFLLAVSLIFYAWGTGEFVLVMIGSILLNYLAALLMEHCTRRAPRKLLLILAVAGNLGIPLGAEARKTAAVRQDDDVAVACHDAYVPAVRPELAYG